MKKMKPAVAMNQLCASTTWKVVNDTELLAAIKVIDKADVVDTVVAETCVLLHCSEPNEPLTLKVGFSPLSSMVIQGFAALCEARHLEIYDSQREYIATVQTDLLEKMDDDGDDFIVYKCDVDLDKPQHAVIIKFLSLRATDEMWLYGLNLQVENRTTSLPSDVKQTLNASLIASFAKNGGALSDKAMKFAGLLGAGLNNRMSIPSSLEFMLSQCGRIPPSAAATSLYSEAAPVETGGHPVVSRDDTTESVCFPGPYMHLREDETVITNLKSVFQTCLAEMENRLWCRIEARIIALEECHNAKLDLILKSLDASFKRSDEYDNVGKDNISSS